MDMLAKAGKYVAGSKGQAKVVSDAAAAQPVGGAAAQPNAENDLQTYMDDMLAARGKPTELKAIKKAAIKQGVDVDSVHFR